MKIVRVAALLFIMLIGIRLPAYAGTVDAEPISIPFIVKDGLPFVSIDLAGQRLNLYIDLGGYTGIALSPDAFQRVSVQRLSESDHYVTASGIVTTAKRFLVPSVDIAGHTFRAIEGTDFSTGPAGVDGYLGFGLLKRYVVVFDYPSSKMRLYSPNIGKAVEEECGAAHFDLSVDESVITSTLETDKGRLLVAWDTGATANVVRPSRSPDPGRRPFWPWNPRILDASDARLGVLSVGPVQFQMVDFTEPEVAGFLGYDFFKSRVVCLDFSRKRGGVRPSGFQKQHVPSDAAASLPRG